MSHECWLTSAPARPSWGFPIAHRKVIRTTNLLERHFGEGASPDEVIADAFGERQVLKRMFAALIRATV